MHVNKVRIKGWLFLDASGTYESGSYLKITRGITLGIRPVWEINSYTLHLLLITSYINHPWHLLNRIKIKIPAPAVVLFLARQGTFLQLRLAEPQRSLARVLLVPGLARPHHAPDQHPGKGVHESMMTTIDYVPKAYLRCSSIKGKRGTSSSV